jgi:methionyl-tRNA formyltransferase
MNKTTGNNFIFFGSSRLSLIVLDELAKHGMHPVAIVTTPDRPKGRKLVLTPPEVKTHGQQNGIRVFQFEKLDEDAVNTLSMFMEKFESANSGKAGGTDGSDRIDYFLVASYGLIIPQAVLDLPRQLIHGGAGVLNIHPSLLPEYRGATPIQQAILDDRSDTGVTIMQIDAKMDHGPILLQDKRNAADISAWPKRYADLEEELARQGANMIAQNIEGMLGINGFSTIEPKEQNHELATFTKKIQKTDGRIGNDDSPLAIEDLDAMLKGEQGYKQFLKFNAYYEWPTTYFFAKKTAGTDDASGSPMRIKITDAVWNSELNEMQIIKVIPEGQKETLWSEFRKKLA